MQKSKKTRPNHLEPHKLDRHNWIRAGGLGTSDGVVSMTALLLGLLAAKVTFNTLWLTGLSAIVAGAFSMAIGEYVSVASQKDIEQANIDKETYELETEPDDELAELTGIYRHRGLSKDLALEVAKELTAHNALEAHLRDELGITEFAKANPIQAAYVSFIAFALGGATPFIFSLISRKLLDNNVIELISPVIFVGIISLAFLGYFSARLGGAPIKPALTRIMLGGISAFAVSSLLGIAAG